MSPIITSGYWADSTTSGSITAGATDLFLWGTSNTMDQTTASTIWTNWNTSTAANLRNQVWAHWAAQGFEQQALRQQDEIHQQQRAAQAQAWALANQPGMFAGIQAANEVRARQAQVAQDSMKKRIEAQKRAEALLRRHLTEEQLQQWGNDRSFIVTAQSGKRYLIKHGLQGNVFEIDHNGERIQSLCVHIPSACPLEDNVLTQLLMLKCDEKTLLALANKTDLRRVA